METHINVKALRLNLQMTQCELGAAIGVDQSTISLWEKGAAPRGPALKLLAMLAGGKSHKAIAKPSRPSTKSNPINHGATNE